jgi:hypothetical protein
MHGLGQKALSWLWGQLDKCPFNMEPHHSPATATSTTPERLRATLDHARIRVLARVGRMRPILRTEEPLETVAPALAPAGISPADSEAAAAAAAAAAALEARGLPASHLHFAVERALRRLGVPARADVTAHRGELFPDLFLLPSPPPKHRAHRPHHRPHHHHHHHHPHYQHHHQPHHHPPYHARGGGGGGGVVGVIVQALDETCFVPGTQTPTDYVLVKQVPTLTSPPLPLPTHSVARLPPTLPASL